VAPIHPLPERRRQALAAALGVTRLARLTGLDRTGVPVAAAVRPGGHVLQVSTGKGESFAAAAAGALAEAAELWSAERPLSVLDATTEQARERFGAGSVVGPVELAPAGAETGGWERLRLAWRTGVDLATGRPALVPAHAVHCPPPGAAPLGPAVVPWTSNGMGAHPSRDAALLHALLELCERDELARALPDGFTAREVGARLLAPASLRRTAPRTAAWVARIASAGFRVHLLDAGAGLGLPCAAAVLVDLRHGPVPVSAGYACRLGRDEALLAALLEAAQSRLTEIHGAREDVAAADRDAALPLARRLAVARATRSAAALPSPGPLLADHRRADGRRAGGRRAATAAAWRAVLARLLRRARRVVVVDLAAPPGLHVVRALAPGLLRSGLLG